MRILISLNDLRPGDTQRGAVELAGAIAAAGHRVVIVGGRGVLAERVRQLGLDLIAIPDTGPNMMTSTVRLMAHVVEERQIDVIHAFEWESIAKAFVAARICAGQVAVTGSVHARSSVPPLPRTIPLLMGSRSAAAGQRAAGHSRVGVLEPWVDTAGDWSVVDAGMLEFRNRRQIGDDDQLIGVATELNTAHSVSNVFAAFDAVGDLADQGVAVHVMLIGDGSNWEAVRTRAAEVNARCGQNVVVFAGGERDRGVAYAACDVVVGSDRSLLEGMALGKPVVVAGESGFFRSLNHNTIEEFSWNGLYGIGSGQRLGKSELLTALEPLMESSRLRDYRGAYARELAQKCDLAKAAQRQIQEYQEAIGTKVGRVGLFTDACRISFASVGRGCGRRQNPRAVRRQPALNALWPSELFGYERDRVQCVNS